MKLLLCQSDACVDKIVKDESMCRSFPYELIRKSCNYIVATYYPGGVVGYSGIVKYS